MEEIVVVNQIKCGAATKGQQIFASHVLLRMSPSASSSPAVQNGLRQTVPLPRESDGVGNALRQMFGAPQGLPTDFGALLNRLNEN